MAETVKPFLPIECVVVGPIENNVYLIGPDEALFVVDPGSDIEHILDVIGERSVAAILLTHRHWDHVGAARALRDATGAPVIASALDAPVIQGDVPLTSGRSFENCPVDRTVNDGDVIEVGPATWHVIATPGHTEGSLCLFAEGGGGVPVLISGDTLFRGTHGRTDFEGGSAAAMEESLSCLAQLPPETIVLPGHNDITTIEHERRWIS